MFRAVVEEHFGTTLGQQGAKRGPLRAYAGAHGRKVVVLAFAPLSENAKSRLFCLGVLVSVHRVKRADERTRTANLISLRVIRQALHELANPAFLGGLLCSALLRVAPYCAPCGVRVVPAGGRKALASPARVAAGSCKLVGGDGPLAQ